MGLNITKNLFWGRDDRSNLFFWGGGGAGANFSLGGGQVGLQIKAQCDRNVQEV